jgi:hypothetical protein
MNLTGKLLVANWLWLKELRGGWIVADSNEFRRVNQESGR